MIFFWWKWKWLISHKGTAATVATHNTQRLLFWNKNYKTATAFLKSKGFFVLFSAPSFSTAALDTSSKSRCWWLSSTSKHQILGFFLFRGRPVFKRLAGLLLLLVVLLGCVDDGEGDQLRLRRQRLPFWWCAAKISSLTKKVLVDHLPRLIAKKFPKKAEKYFKYLQIIHSSFVFVKNFGNFKWIL